jgi:hypothetical protein
MNTEVIYLQDTGDSYYSLYEVKTDSNVEQVDFDSFTKDVKVVTYSIGPWEKDVNFAEEFRGQIDFTISDTESGILLTKNSTQEQIMLDYGELDQIAMLFDAWNRDQDFRVTFKRFVEAE